MSQNTDPRLVRKNYITFTTQNYSPNNDTSGNNKTGSGADNGSTTAAAPSGVNTPIGVSSTNNNVASYCPNTGIGTNIGQAPGSWNSGTIVSQAPGNWNSGTNVGQAPGNWNSGTNVGQAPGNWNSGTMSTNWGGYSGMMPTNWNNTNWPIGSTVPNQTMPTNWPPGAPNQTIPTNWPTGVSNPAIPTNWPTGVLNPVIPTNWPTGVPNPAIPTNWPTGAPNQAIPTNWPIGGTLPNQTWPGSQTPGYNVPTNPSFTTSYPMSFPGNSWSNYNQQALAINVYVTNSAATAESEKVDELLNKSKNVLEANKEEVNTETETTTKSDDKNNKDDYCIRDSRNVNTRNEEERISNHKEKEDQRQQFNKNEERLGRNRWNTQQETIHKDIRNNKNDNEQQRFKNGWNSQSKHENRKGINEEDDVSDDIVEPIKRQKLDTERTKKNANSNKHWKTFEPHQPDFQQRQYNSHEGVDEKKQSNENLKDIHQSTSSISQSQNKQFESNVTIQNEQSNLLTNVPSNVNIDYSKSKTDATKSDEQYHDGNIKNNSNLSCQLSTSKKSNKFYISKLRTRYLNTKWAKLFDEKSRFLVFYLRHILYEFLGTNHTTLVHAQFMARIFVKHRNCIKLFIYEVKNILDSKYGKIRNNENWNRNKQLNEHETNDNDTGDEYVLDIWDFKRNTKNVIKDEHENNDTKKASVRMEIDTNLNEQTEQQRQEIVQNKINYLKSIQCLIYEQYELVYFDTKTKEEIQSYSTIVDEYIHILTGEEFNFKQHGIEHIDLINEVNKNQNDFIIDYKYEMITEIYEHFNLSVKKQATNEKVMNQIPIEKKLNYHLYNQIIPLIIIENIKFKNKHNPNINFNVHKYVRQNHRSPINNKFNDSDCEDGNGSGGGGKKKNQKKKQMLLQQQANKVLSVKDMPQSIQNFLTNLSPTEIEKKTTLQRDIRKLIEASNEFNEFKLDVKKYRPEKDSNDVSNGTPMKGVERDLLAHCIQSLSICCNIVQYRLYKYTPYLNLDYKEKYTIFNELVNDFCNQIRDCIINKENLCMKKFIHWNNIDDIVNARSGRNNKTDGCNNSKTNSIGRETNDEGNKDDEPFVPLPKLSYGIKWAAK